MTNRLYICLTLFVGCFFCGQNVIVQDSISLVPLEDVIVESNTGNGVYGKTNHLGQVTLPRLTVDSIKLSLDDYQTKIISTHQLIPNKQNVIYLKGESFKLNNIIVSGSNWKNRSKKHTAHKVSLTETDIREINQPTTADILQKTHEVFIQKSQLGGGSPMIRGFATNRLLIAVDGINMNNAIFRSGNIQNIIAIDPFTVQKIEVLNGPSSLMYGSDAIGGVLSFETESLVTSDKLNVNGDLTYRYASATHENTGHLDIDISNENWATLTSITASDFGDARMGKHGPSTYLRDSYVIREDGNDVVKENENPNIQKFSGYKQLNLLQKFLYQFSNNFNIRASIFYSKTSDVPRYDRLLRKTLDGQFRSAENYYGPQEWVLNMIQSNLYSQNILFDHWESLISHQYFTESRHNRGFGSDNKFNRFERVNLWAWENNFLKEFNSTSKLLYGFDARLNHINSKGFQENIETQEKATIPSRYPNGSNWNQFGIYARLHSNLSPSLILNTGLRYSYVNSTSTFDTHFYNFPFENANFSTDAITGSIELNYNATARFKLNTQFSTGFRAPNIDDIAKVFDSEPGTVVVPNPNLAPEYVYSAEVGAAYSFGDLIYVKGLAYYSWLENALVRRDFMLNGESMIEYDGVLSQVQAIQNASQARIYGGLFLIEYNINRNIKLYSKLNYVKGREESSDGTDLPMRHAAPMFGNITLENTFNKLKLILDYSYNAKVDAKDLPISERRKSYLYALNNEGLPYVPEIHVVNFSSQYQLNEYITMQFRIDNIFDRRYRPYSSGITALGRNFVFSIRTIF